ncbi:MAG: glutathione S-transferase family protein [Paracoccaceae bacterium]
MYKVIGTNKSRAFRVTWALEELEQKYEHVACAPRSEQANLYNPLGKIPALVDGDSVLTDSTAIVTYLADKHGGLTAKAGSISRAHQDAMTMWVIDEMDALLWSYSKHTRVLPEKQRVAEVGPAVRSEFEHSLVTLAESLGDKPFLMGDALTVPDIFATHCIGWSVMAGFPPLPDALKAYSKRMRARPAYKKAGARS